MSRRAINPLYIKLESAWSRLCDKLYNKENYWSRYDYAVMRNAEVLVLLKPLIQKYILYISICDACLKTRQSDASFHNLNNLIDKIQNLSAQVMTQVLNDASRPAGSLLQPSSSDGRALGDQVTEAGLEKLDLIYFIINQTSLEQNVFDRNCKNELVFKLEEHKTLYKYYFKVFSTLTLF